MDNDIIKDNFIYINKTSLTKEMCIEIIELFEKEENAHFLGITGMGYKPKIKKTIDLVLSNFFENNINIKYIEKWDNIIFFLEKELSKNLKKYLDNLNKIYNTNFFMNDKYFLTKGFLLHKYYKNNGKFEYHNDFSITDFKNKHRVIVFLWYLNDVKEGGETEIFNNILIKPKTGKLLLFPALWYYKHKGHIPISDDKYIITGWFYSDNIYIK